MSFQNTRDKLKRDIKRMIDEDYDASSETVEYYLAGIERNDIHVMFDIGIFYEGIRNYKEMEKYFLMCIELNDRRAMLRLASYYNKIKNYEEMKKYYLMASDLNDEIAMYYLSKYYECIEHNYNKSRKYLLMAVMTDSTWTMIMMDYYNIEFQHYFLRNIKLSNSIKKIEQLEKNNFLGVKIFEELTKYVFNPIRVIKISEMYNSTFEDYMDLM